MKSSVVRKLRKLRETKSQSDFIDLHNCIKEDGYYKSGAFRIHVFVGVFILLSLLLSALFCKATFILYAFVSMFFLALFYKRVIVTFLIYKSYMQWSNYKGKEFPEDSLRFDKIFNYEERFQLKSIISRDQVVFSFRRLISKDGLSFEFVTWSVFKPFKFSRYRICRNFNKFNFECSYSYSSDTFFYEIRSLGIIDYIISYYFPNPIGNDLKDNIWYY